MNGTLNRPDPARAGHTRPFLLCDDLARFFTEERRRDDPGAKPVPVGSVYAMRAKSKPGKRYADNPLPEADGVLSGNQQRADAGRGSQPWWRPEREDELREWYRTRRRPGRPRKS